MQCIEEVVKSPAKQTARLIRPRFQRAVCLTKPLQELSLPFLAMPCLLRGFGTLDALNSASASWLYQRHFMAFLGFSISSSSIFFDSQVPILQLLLVLQNEFEAVRVE